MWLRVLSIARNFTHVFILFWIILGFTYILRFNAIVEFIEWDVLWTYKGLSIILIFMALYGVWWIVKELIFVAQAGFAKPVLEGELKSLKAFPLEAKIFKYRWLRLSVYFRKNIISISDQVSRYSLIAKTSSVVLISIEVLLIFLGVNNPFLFFLHLMWIPMFFIMPNLEILILKLLTSKSNFLSVSFLKDAKEKKRVAELERRRVSNMKRALFKSGMSEIDIDALDNREIRREYFKVVKDSRKGVK